ncbi:MAG: sigma-70 family RNA polymerase sigma factor [Chitinophagaceae bacterium]|nr:sigma-70 family RNA polymerase sigma factor [Chitinophagaceae bacterium]
MKPANSDEQQLVRDIGNGDASAFDVLYWKYHKSVYTNILRLIKDQEASKDILQEVFITLWIKRTALNPDKSIAGWLFTTAHRKCIDYLRCNTAKPLLVEEMIIADEPAGLIKMEQEKRLQLLQQAISDLSPKKRKVFELCKLNGKTYEETARELNISKHTVKEYLTAATIHIKDYIHHQPQSLISIFLILFVFYPPRF